MLKTTLRAIAGVYALALLLPFAGGPAQPKKTSGARAAEPITIPMTADRWQTKENAEFLRQLGFFHGLMRLNSGNAALKGTTFGNGTIEFDVAFSNSTAFPGISFRAITPNDYELFYLRAMRSAQWDATQYTPVLHGLYGWQIYTGAAYHAAL